MEDLIFKTFKKALPKGDAFLFVNFIEISFLSLNEDIYVYRAK